MQRGSTVIVVIIVVLIILAGSIAAPLLLIGNYLAGPLDKATGQAALITSDECITPLYPPVTDEKGFADAINAYIADKSPPSPFKGTGDIFVAAGKKYGVNPAWVINIARKESSFGMRIPPGSNNAYGRTATASQPGIDFNGRRWYKYDSFPASIDPQSEFLKRRYIDEGLLTIEQITNVYAPPSENNTNGYIDQMKQWIGQIMVLAGSSVACPDSPRTGITS